MNFGKPRIFIFILLTACTGFLLSTCSDENTFTAGQNFLEATTNLVIVDTYTVEMSTVVQDSVPTSGTGAMLIGGYQDTLFGYAGCSGFFQIGLPESILLDEKDIYDSISMIIHFSGYSYGDTNGMMRINVHRLTEDIEANEDGYLYNTSVINYDPGLLGSSFFRALPDTSKSIEIKIDDAFGLELFNKFVTRSSDITMLSDFLGYFKGIALLNDESSDRAILGFAVSAEKLKLRLYTHRVEQTNIATSYDFPVVNTNIQFNHIDYDFEGTPFELTQDEETAIPSSLTKDKAFVQGYKKIMTKVRFPYIPDILLNARGIIMKAELIFEPMKNSYKYYELPTFVILYETNRRNQPLGLVYDNDGSVLKASLIVDNQYHELTSYTFDITGFITNEIADGYYDVEHGLLVSLYDEQYQLNFERIVIEAKTPAPKLKIYYLKY